MARSEADQPRLGVRSRTNAALVFGFHSDLRRVPTRSERAVERLRRPVAADVAIDSDESSSTLGWAFQIVIWIAMLAAIAAPWVLLLTG